MRLCVTEFCSVDRYYTWIKSQPTPLPPIRVVDLEALGDGTKDSENAVVWDSEKQESEERAKY
jgi:hypothetical protein